MAPTRVWYMERGVCVRVYRKFQDTVSNSTGHVPSTSSLPPPPLPTPTLSLFAGTGVDTRCDVGGADAHGEGTIDGDD